MNKKIDNIPAWFEPDAEFELTPRLTVPFRGTQETELERLKTLMLRDLLAKATDPELNAPLRRAANEAAGLAWLTPFPLLFFPELLAERATVAARQMAKQGRVREKTRNLIMEVAA